MRHIVKLTSYFTFACTAFCLNASAQMSPPQATAKVLTSDRCSLTAIDPAAWRDARAGDYFGSGWAAWKRIIKRDKPWEAVGDFDGDGLPDVVKVIVNETDKTYMMGVIFGKRDGEPCRIKQLAQGSLVLAGQSAIAGVLVFPKQTKSMVCHQVAERGKATCTLTAQGAFADVKTDAVLSFDEAPTFVNAYVLRNIVKNSPMAGPNMKFAAEGADPKDGISVFVSQKIQPEMDIKSMQ